MAAERGHYDGRQRRDSSGYGPGAGGHHGAQPYDQGQQQSYGSTSGPYGQDPYGYGQYSQYGQYGPDSYGQGPYGQGSYEPGQRRRQPRVAAGRLWAGGVTAAVVAALASFVALMLVRGVLDIPVYAPHRHGTLVPATSGALAAGSALAALLATAVLHLLMLSTPQPERFFGWLVALATLAVVLLPFTSGTDWAAKIGTAAVHLLLGVVIGSLLTAVSRSAGSDYG